MGKEESDGIRIPAGNGRMYFLDVKEAKTGSKYLIFSESKKNKEGKFDRQRIMVFADHFREVYDALKKVASEFGIGP
ncbi:MAG TPA: DUF3276 family protein [Candidatus Kryptonia bacterium]